MISPALIDRAVQLIVSHYDPALIYIVGSYSVGTATDASDLDLLVVKETAAPRRRRQHQVQLILSSLLIPVDVNVYTPGEFDEELRDAIGFARTVTKLQGKLVYRRVNVS